MRRIGRFPISSCVTMGRRAHPFPPMLLVVMAGGAALFASNPAHAACDNHDPTTGQTATCDTSAPNPDTTRVQAVAGSTNVNVNVLPGAAINVNAANGVLV